MSESFNVTHLAAVLNAEEEGAKQQRARDLSGETAANKFPMTLHKGSSAIARPVLSSPLFAFRKDSIRLTYTVAHPLVVSTYSCEQYGDNCMLTYQGEQLRQDDQRVLIGLIESLGGREVDDCIAVNARDFCEHIGWGRYTTSVEKLKESLIRLYGASLQIRHRRGMRMTRFLSHAEILDGEMVVNLHRDMLHFFEAGFTYLRIEQYRVLTDGFATWLYGFLKAHTDETCFDLEDVRKASGSTADTRTFGTMMRQTMEKFVDEGFVGAFQFKRGKLMNVSWRTVAQALA